MPDNLDFTEFVKKYHVLSYQFNVEGPITTVQLELPHYQLERLSSLSRLADHYAAWSYQNTEEVFLREKYPAAQIAWDKYQTVLKIVNK